MSRSSGSTSAAVLCSHEEHVLCATHVRDHHSTRAVESDACGSAGPVHQARTVR
jgi:hypothetical protein